MFAENLACPPARAIAEWRGKAISLPLPVTMLEELKALANVKDVPYQSLLKVFLDPLARERGRGETA
jgi:hypothetical protein